MNVLEMHIALKQGVDKIHSQRDDQLLPQEIDIELNRAMQRFIDQHYGKNNLYQEGFEQSQKRIDELRSLLVEYEDSVIFKEEVINGSIWADTFQLPSNYMYLVNQRSKIFLNNCNVVNYNYEQLSNVFYFTFNLQKFFVDTSGPSFLSNIMMETPSQSTELVWSPSLELQTAGFDPNQFPENTTALVNDILNNSQPGFDVYWQSFGELDFPGQFIVVVDSATYPTITTQTTLVSYNSTNTPVESRPLIQLDRSSLTKRVPEPPFTETQVLNRFSQQDDIYRLLNDPFNTTYEKEPLTTIRDSFIDIYTSSIFIIDSVKISYIRKPLPISISLGYDCELPDHTHQTIIDMAVSSILERTADPRYKTQIGELANRE